MTKVYVLEHSYEIDGCDETKMIGVYSSLSEAENAQRRASQLSGFRDRPDNFIIDAYELDTDHWTSGYVTIVGIQVPDVKGKWTTVSAVVLASGYYEIVEKYRNDLLGKFKDGDVVRCEIRRNAFYAIEKIDE